VTITRLTRPITGDDTPPDEPPNGGGVLIATSLIILVDGLATRSDGKVMMASDGPETAPVMEVAISIYS